MEIFQVVLLALIQGITEFLPISSSAHLILPAQLLGWQDQGLAFDVAVHVGSLIAVVSYFRKDLIGLTLAWFTSFTHQTKTTESTLAWSMLYATIPAVIVGWLINGYANELRSTLVIAIATIVFGLLLAYADRKTHEQSLSHISLKQAVIIGLMQCLALIPGTSRSGITMTAGLLLGLSREASARFSFLLSVPLILAAGIFKTVELVQSQQQVDWFSMLLGAVLSGISAYICIKLFLSWINKIGFMPFVIYRLLLGFVLLIIVFV